MRRRRARSPCDVEDVIQALVDKSLVNAAAGAADVRYTQLQTLAHYGREKLAERGEAGRDPRRDGGVLRPAVRPVGGGATSATSSGRGSIAVAEEQDNLRAALEWAVATDDAETALTIAGGASWAHWLAGTAVEAKRWLDEAFACAGDGRATPRGPWR